jgi:predicted Zn-dependent protease
MIRQKLTLWLIGLMRNHAPLFFISAVGWTASLCNPTFLYAKRHMLGCIKSQPSLRFCAATARILQHFGFIIAIILILSSNTGWAYSPYSNRELDELEKEFIEEINSSSSVIRNPLANQYINQLGARLAKHGQLHAPYFFIVKSNEINAFAGPGGYIGINSQLILASANESELAAVMAHEMAHVRQHHLYRMIEHQKQMRIPMLASMLAAIALGAVNPSMGTGAVMASMAGFTQDSINYVRSNEKEADRIGIDMLIRSGLDARGMANFFKKMQENARYYYTANIPSILRSHPLDEERIAEAENRSAHLSQNHVPDSLSYQLFKEMIRVAATTDNTKQMLDYYQHECSRPNSGMACQYGYALALMDSNQFQNAYNRLEPLLQQDASDIDIQIAMAEAETGLKHYEQAVTRLKTLNATYPENYAVGMALAHSLVESQRPADAASLLLKMSRQHPRDLAVCEALARAQSVSQRRAYAYFTQARCELLQGKRQIAMRQLKLAKQLSSKDRLLSARIDAKIDDIEQMTILDKD